ncbi:uncharacterized protein LOC133309522 [Gastrolobium bilobum]|uniref:uncharacterized protein LOC133309522 n=1 Tax=Gastrolobium bilobum TaxID=150636 RepID=UPI002AAF7189|nr:uncharacterized protein LOC133309522 [Gastrolobium bilobum]
MSGSDDEEISNVDRRGYREGGSDGDDDNDDDGDDDAAIGKKQSRRMGIGKAKQVVLHQFTKAKRQIRRIRSKRTLLPSSSSSSSSSSGNASITGSGFGQIAFAALPPSLLGLEDFCVFCCSLSLLR